MQETRQSINDFFHLNEKIPTARELYDRMLAIDTDWVNPGSLWGSANAEGTDDKIDLRR